VQTIYEAAEHHSATLAMHIEYMAKQRGWAARTLSGMVMDAPPGSGRPRMIYGASVLLPGGRAASFIPSPAPHQDGESWSIVVRRSDGVSRPAWNVGIFIRKAKDHFALLLGTDPLDDQRLARVLDAIGVP
jgi:hypothetical protein